MNKHTSAPAVNSSSNGHSPGHVNAAESNGLSPPEWEEAVRNALTFLRMNGGDRDVAALDFKHLPPEVAVQIVAEADRRLAFIEAAPLPECTDLGNAELFCRLHADQLRHVKERRQWLRWQDGRWRPDRTGEVERAAKETARSRLRMAAALEGEERKYQAKYALRSQDSAKVRAMIELASTEPEVVLAADALDADPWLLGCGNGTLDLRTGELRTPRPEDLISAGTDVPYEPEFEPVRWLQFLDEVFRGDRELIGFVRRLCGYTLTGDTREEVLAVFHGTGGNGKSKFIEVLKALLGDLAATAAFDSFARSANDRGARNDIARLHRARLVVASESGEGRHLDEATIKQLTGGDTVTARFLYAEHFEFRPQFKLVLVTNHRPRVDGDDDAIWRRLKLVPFEECFEGPRKDRELAAKLAAELPGILAWAVEGCLEWQRDRLGQAGAVERATHEYREGEDVLGAFIAERCKVAAGLEVPKVELRRAYEDYCRDLGEQPMGASGLGRRLSSRGFGTERQGQSARAYRGLALIKAPSGGVGV